MKRRKFIATTCISCISGGFVSSLSESCASAKVANAVISGSDIIVQLSDFELKRGSHTYKRYLVVYNDLLQYPICVYRFDENTYHALWMRCTHQGTELQVFGDKLQCPAHGSEFNNNGQVDNGPADHTLRTFPVLIKATQLNISLL